MPEKPLLILPKIGPPLPRKKQSIFPREYIRLPSRQEQAHRFMAKFESMKESVLDNTPDGKSVENILVLESVGKIENFKAAANKIPGLEWQAEVDIDDLESDSIFFEKPKIGVQFLKKKTSAFEAIESKEIHTAFKNKGIIDDDNRLKENYTIDEIKGTIPDKYKDKSDIILETIEKERSKPLQGRVYLSLSNRQALDQVKNLFDAYQKGEDPPGHNQIL